MSAEAVVQRHGEGCECVRCRGFEPGNGYGPLRPGNQIATRHGAYSVLRLSDRARSIADHLRDELPAGSRADEVSLELLSVTLARVEAAERALAQLDEQYEEKPLAVYLSGRREQLERLRQDMRGWVHSAHRLAESLGLSSKSRAQIGVDVAQIQRVGRDLLDLKRLSDEELVTLRELHAKAVPPELVEAEEER